MSLAHSSVADTASNGGTNADRAYEIVRERLVMLDIRPGEPINDDRLAEELGFGRTPVREALKRLERERLVVAYPRRGTFATAVDMTDLADISEIRKQLEPTAAARAARTASPDARARLTALADEIAEIDDSEDPREVLRKDVRVHREIYRASGNPHLEDILVSLDAHATRIWCLFLDRLPDVASHVREHVSLLRAIVDGDESTASSLTLAHVAGFEKAIRDLL
ncbi:GntR family transcriptional regulator [Rhodococcus opacus]|uniref:GntR family transcriptional regulator n=3 Tax=Rhodococcus opacus TaxID=37919 RepID=A0A1B1KBN5_RHOOP|nr:MULTISPECIES: GntR family transcriptional regulator [Rhodococcus]ELB87314.1 GntR family transcriptional regulator [Rhodococcus wratislaviensis IFP 2016]KXF51135.1 GntR family transcriptional regulator [Rhodococcus sp. SC4]NDV03893.1 GntR family transcriptional regulator [Rhodococcus sp. IEGM 248]NHU42101.1 GntR family transcriptional regulator [Rhodococcus sp. A14]ANS30001.1 GntR family transcriptional regulator [Rhodococcus opacus]